MKVLSVLIALLIYLPVSGQDAQIFICNDGKVDFVSNAPLELIKASSDELAGALNITDRSFSFRIASKSFEGFNTPLQRIHFNEDYLESKRYPNSMFKGKIIEEIDLKNLGNYTIRAKGILTIHGIEYNRIIRCNLEVKKDLITVKSSFTVFLDDHNITIPSIVNQKIAEEISVEINLNLKPR
ncbi:YceI family protein [Bacteroidota bacterium]